MATFIAARTSGGRSVEVSHDEREHAVEEAAEAYPVSIICPGRWPIGSSASSAIPSANTRVPADAYYGIQTARARRELPASAACARPPTSSPPPCSSRRPRRRPTWRSAGSTRASASAIISAADEVLGGALRDQFVVDVYQAGAGTSHNMNVNEVLANRAAEILGGARGEYTLGASERSRQHGAVHQRRVPDGDAARAAARTSTRWSTRRGRWPRRLHAKGRRVRDVLKVGRTHLQDAVPMTLGQEFGGYAACIERGADDVEQASEQLQELNLGATAVGTGLNAGDDYTRRADREPRRSITGLDLDAGGESLPRHAEHGRRRSRYSGAMRRLAVELGKIASDLRLLSMGPRAGSPRSRCPPCSPGRRSCRAR